METINIVGGGLSGLTLGIALRKRSIPVRILEAGTYPRHRVCGEFISGVNERCLDQLGITDLFDGASTNHSSVWFEQDRPAFEKALPKPAFALSRYRLDKALAERFTACGGILETGTRFKGEGATGTVFASGRPRNQSGQWIGIKCHLLDFALHADLEMHLGDSAYLGINRIEDGKANACGLFRIRPGMKSPRLGLMPAYLEACGLPRLAKRIRDARKDETSCLGVNAFELGRQARSEKSKPSHAVRIGDQFAIIGPFTGNGMSMAFESAAAALDPLTAFAEGEKTWSACRNQIDSDLARRFKRRLLVSGLLNPFLIGGNRQKLLIALGKSGFFPFGAVFRASR